jgi:tetratricopeptide (TPR) repeat protein
MHYSQKAKSMAGTARNRTGAYLSIGFLLAQALLGIGAENLSPAAYAAPLPADVLSSAEAAYLKGDISTLESLSRENGENPAILDMIGKIYHKQGNINRAVDYYQKALQIDSRRHQSLFNLGVACFDQADYARAESLFRQAIKQMPSNVEYRHNLALALERQDKIKESIDAYKAAIKIGSSKDDPALAQSFYCLARLYQKQGGDTDQAQAIELYKKAIEIDPKLVAAYNNLGVAYSEQGRYPEAIELYQKALSIDGGFSEARKNLGYAQAHTSLGITYFKLKRYDKALAEYSKAVSLDPDFADAHYNLGVFYQRESDLDRAISHYRRAIELDPSNARACNNLGVALMSRGAFAEAEKYYLEALRRDPDFSDAKANLESLRARSSSKPSY